ncbi:MAG: RidA family protein [Cellvibrionaceae bacterium]
MSITKESYRSGIYKNVFAQAVKVGNLLHISGQVGMDAKGKLGADLAEQTKIAYDNIQQVLSKFEATLDNIVDETMFVTDMGEFMKASESVLGARAEAYGGVPEVCQTLVQVSALVMPELKIEIKCVAQL